MDSPELYLRKKYWLDGMKNMRKINPDMEFMIITNDVKEANKFLPGIPAYNFDLAKDYSILKNARYLLLANSSFAYFPAFTSDTVEYIIAVSYTHLDVYKRQVLHSPLVKKELFRIKGKLLGARDPSDIYVQSRLTDPLTMGLSLIHI